MLEFFVKHYLEIIGAISGLVYLYFSVNQKLWLWPVGIISSAFFVVVFFKSQLYADMSLNIYYLVVSIYGWYHWLRKRDNVSHESIKITTLSEKNWLEYFLITGLLTIGFSWILIHIPEKIGWEPSSVPVWDAFLTAGSIIATWMLARKVLEQWLWWVVIDSISVGIFIYKGLYFTAGLFVVNTIIAFVGYIKWKKDYKMQ
jgi:nicotinamide mononucleotide transporter